MAHCSTAVGIAFYLLWKAKVHGLSSIRGVVGVHCVKLEGTRSPSLSVSNDSTVVSVFARFLEVLRFSEDPLYSETIHVLQFYSPTERGLCSLVCCIATKPRCCEGAGETWEQPQPPEPCKVTLLYKLYGWKQCKSLAVLINNGPNICYTPTVHTSQLFVEVQYAN